MNKKPIARLTCFSMALAVIFGATALYYGQKASVYGSYISFQNQRAMSALLESVDALDGALQKTAWIPSGEMRSMLAAEIWRRCEGAKAALSVMPLGTANLEKTEKYLAQAGDYAFYLLRQGIYGGTPEKDAENLLSLSKISASLLPQLTGLKEQFDAGDAIFEAMVRGQSTATPVTDILSKSEKDFPEYAPLMYDGPFSEHISQLTPKALKGINDITAVQAEASAAKLLGRNGLNLQYESAGEVPCYWFSAGESRSICVTKAGGKLLAYTDDRECGETTISADDAVALGEKWLQSYGYDNMISTYYTVSGGIANINYVYSQDRAVVYPDLITLGIALDNGGVVRMDARGYLMNHIKRQAPSTDQSLSATPSLQGMKVISQRLAVIPTSGKNEVWCREFLCQLDDGKALVYINCESGKTENVLLLVESENGTLLR